MNQGTQILTILQQLLGGLIGLRQDTKQMQWFQYPGGGIYQPGSKHDVLYNKTRQQISSVISSFGFPGAQLVGDLAGRIGAQALVGKPTNQYGMANTILALQPGAVGGATTSSAFQGMLYSATNRYLKGKGQDDVQDQLRKSYLTRYYKTIYKDKSDDIIQQHVRSAMNNPFAMPNILKFILDPQQLDKQVQGITEAAQNTMRWGMRSNPLSTKNGTAAVQFQKYLKQATQKASQDTGDFGGFTPASISQLVASMSATKDIFRDARNSTDPDAIKNQIQNFDAHLKKLTRALMPMRDVFGNDMAAITGMISSITGRAIGDLSIQRVRSTANIIADAAKYTGASPRAMGTSVGAVQALMQGYGADYITRNGRANLGPLTMAVTSGQTPGYMTKQEFQAVTANTYAGAQSSIGVRRLAQAYGLAQNIEKDLTVQQFVSRLQASDNPMQAAMEMAGVSSMNQLMRGDSYKGTMEALSSGLLAKVGASQQYRDNLMMALQANGGTNQDISQMYKALTNTQNADLIKKAFRGIGKDQQLSYTDSQGKKQKLTSSQIQLLNRMAVNNPQLAGYAQVHVEQANFAKFQEYQDKLRTVFGKWDQRQSGGIKTFVNNFLTNNPYKDNDPAKRQLFQVTTDLITGNIFQMDKSDQVSQGKIRRRLTQAFGSKTAGTALSAALTGYGASNQKYQEALRTIVSEQSTDSQKYKDAKSYILNQIAFGDNVDKVQKMSSRFNSVRYKTAQDTFAKQMQKAGNDRNAQQAAISKYQRTVIQEQYAVTAQEFIRNQNAAWEQQAKKNKTTAKQFTGKDQQILSRLAARQAQGLQIDYDKQLEGFGAKAGLDTKQKRRATYNRMRRYSSMNGSLDGSVANLQQVIKLFVGMFEQLVGKMKTQDKK